MTDTPTGDTPTGRAPRAGLDSSFDQLRRIPLRRDTSRSWLGGVCSGIAARFGLDPTVVRALAVLLGLLLGAGVVLYLLAWLVVPAQDERTHLERALRHGEGGSVVLLVVTAIAVFGGFPWWFGDGFLGGWSFVGVVLAALVIWGVFYALRPQGGAAGAPYWQGPPFDTTPTASPGSAQTHEDDPMTSPPGDTRPMPHAAAGTPASATETHHPAGGADPSGHGPAGPGFPGGAAPWGPGHGQPAGPPPSGPVPPHPGAPGYPPVPPKPRRPTGGVTAALVVAGLVLVAYGVVVWLAGEYDWPGNHHVVAVASALFVAGGAVLVLGATGRRSGFPGVLAVVLLVLTLITAPLPSRVGVRGEVGDRVWQPGSVTAGDSYNLAAGEAVLDLTELDAADIEADALPVTVGFGELTIVVPDDLTVKVTSTAAVGEIAVEQPAGREVTGGVGPASSVTVGDGPVDLTVDAQVTAGQITIERD